MRDAVLQVLPSLLCSPMGDVSGTPLVGVEFADGL